MGASVSRVDPCEVFCCMVQQPEKTDAVGQKKPFGLRKSGSFKASESPDTKKDSSRRRPSSFSMSSGNLFHDSETEKAKIDSISQSGSFNSKSFSGILRGIVADNTDDVKSEQLLNNWSPGQQKSLEHAIELAACSMHIKPPGFFAVQVRTTCSPQTQHFTKSRKIRNSPEL
jgi:hypothetical protein